MTNSRCKFPMLDMRFYLLPDTRTAGSHLRHWKSGTLLTLWKLQIEDILLAASLFVNGTFSTMGILQFCEAGSACGLFGWRYHKCIGGIFIQTWPYGLLGWRYHQTQFRNPYLCNHLFTTFFSSICYYMARYFLCYHLASNFLCYHLARNLLCYHMARISGETFCSDFDLSPLMDRIA